MEIWPRGRHAAEGEIAVVGEMFRRAVFCLFVATLVGAPGSAAQTAQAAGASEFIRALGDEAIRVLQDPAASLDRREAMFRALLKDGFDIAFLGRFVLAKEWRRASPEQQSEYQELFGEYILATYSSRFGGYAGEALTIVGERPAGKQNVVVSTRIDRPSGAPIRADWRVRADEDAFRIIDVSIEGVSMAITHRSEFGALVQRSGIDGLIGVLRARAEKMPAMAVVR